MLTFQVSRAVRNAFWDRQGANKLNKVQSVGMSSIPTGRREVGVRGDGGCFSRAVALAVDGKADHAYPVF